VQFDAEEPFAADQGIRVDRDDTGDAVALAHSLTPLVPTVTKVDRGIGQRVAGAIAAAIGDSTVMLDGWGWTDSGKPRCLA
jgi:hypothetical protein